jgi:hypothetical protein
MLWLCYCLMAMYANRVKTTKINGERFLKQAKQVDSVSVIQI